ncbi:MAG: IclR family transcriptional regulator [Salinirussus sp.]
MCGRDTVDSDERLFGIVETLQRREPAGVTELADAVGMPKSTVHVHLSTLGEWGYVVQDDRQRYRLGLKFLELGIVARDHRRIYEEAAPTIEELAAGTGENVWCVVEENGEAVFVAKAAGSRAIQTNARVGQHVDLYRLAAGKAILATLPADRRGRIVDGYEFPLEGTGAGREELTAELAEIRDRGVAFGAGGFVSGVAGVGAAVTDNSGTVHGAISISGPTGRLSGDRLEGELADLIRGAAGELQVNLSYG